MNFTLNEKKILTKNVELILDFLKENACPYVRGFHIFKFKDDPSHKPIMIEISTGKNGCIQFTRGFNSSEYKLGQKYDPSYWSEEQRKKRYNFWECYDVMFALIENWPNLKKEIMDVVEHDKNVITTLKNFTI